MDGITIGYTRVAADEQGLPSQRETLVGLGVQPDRLHFGRRLTGTTRPRPGLGEALAASREGDTLVVTKLHRLARSIPDLADIGVTFAAKGVALSANGAVYDPTDPAGRVFFDTLALAADFDADLMRSLRPSARIGHGAERCSAGALRL